MANPEHLRLVKQGPEAFTRWRYLDGPGQIYLLALAGSRCVGILGAFRRDYRWNDEIRRCLEPFDWHLLPDHRGLGLGTRMGREMMELEDSQVVQGGLEYSRRLLRHLGWRMVGTGIRHVLPLESAGIVVPARRRLGLPSPLARAAFSVTLKPWFRPRRKRPPFAGTVVAITRSEELLPLYGAGSGYGLLAVPPAGRVEWLAAAPPEAGRYLAIGFTDGEKLRGWSLLRLYTEAGHRAATIVELHASRPGADLYSWMVSETLIQAMLFRPEKIVVEATCPLLREALRRNRFLQVSSFEVHIWARSGALPSEPYQINSNIGDGPFLPYETSRAAASA